MVEESSFPAPAPPPPPEEDAFPLLTSEDLALPTPPPPNQEVEGISNTGGAISCQLSCYLSLLVLLHWCLSQRLLLLLLQWCSCPGGVTAASYPPPLALCLSESVLVPRPALAMRAHFSCLRVNHVSCCSLYLLLRTCSSFPQSPEGKLTRT